MTSHFKRLEHALDALGNPARLRLTAWQVLRLCEDRPLRERDLGPAGRIAVEDLVQIGWLNRSHLRSLLPWGRRVVFKLTSSGEEQLRSKRKELKRLQALIQGSLETGWDLLEGEGVDPAEFHFERMLLVHGRFADQPAGFPERDARLSKLVRDVENDSRIQADDDGLTAASAVGLFSKLN